MLRTSDLRIPRFGGRKCLALVLAMVLPPAYASSQKGDTQGPTPIEVSLKLTLATDKPTYKAGEPIRIIYSFENAGDTPFYVSPSVPVPGVGDSLEEFDVTVYDEAGKKLPHEGLEGLFTGFDPKVDVLSWVRSDWIRLAPGHFYGGRHQLPPNWYKAIHKPGRYKLVASYYNYLTHWVTKEQREGLEELRYPIWSGQITSNAVWIEIED